MNEYTKVKIIIAVLITGILLCVLPFACNQARAGIHNNSAADSGEDTVTVTFSLLDTLGQPTLAVTGDSAIIFYLNPTGAKSDSMRIDIAASATTTKTLLGGKTIITYTYPQLVANIDDICATCNGVWRWKVYAIDEDLDLVSYFTDEFQVNTGWNLSDSAIVDGSSFASLDNAIDVGVLAQNCIGTDETGAGCIDSFAISFNAKVALANFIFGFNDTTKLDTSKFGAWLKTNIGTPGQIWGANDTGVVDTSKIGAWLKTNIGTPGQIFGTNDTSIIDTSKLGEWLASNMSIDTDELTAKVDTNVWETKQVYNTLSAEDWTNHFFQYDDGILFSNCDTITDWTFEHGGNGRIDEEYTFKKEGDAGVHIWTGDGDTAVIYTTLPTYSTGRPRIPHLSNITFDLYIDTNTFYRSPRCVSYADSASSLHYLKVMLSRNLEDGPFNTTTGGFMQYLFLDQSLVSGWQTVTVPVQGMAEIGDADSCDIDLANKYIGFEVGVDGAGDSVSIVIDNIRFNERGRAKVIFRYDDGLISQYTRAWPLHRKYHQRAAFAVRGNDILGVGATDMHKAELDEIYAGGNDIINHGWNALALIDVTDSTARIGIDKGQQVLLDLGYPRGAGVFAHASNSIDTIGLRIVKENHQFACGGRNSIHRGHVDVITDPTADELYNFPYVYMEYSESETMDRYRRMIDTAIMQGSLLILSMHDICSADSANGSDGADISTNVDSLDALLSYVYDLRASIDVTTFSEYFSHQRTWSAQLNTIEDNTDELKDSVKTLDNWIWALRDSLALAYADLDAIADGEVADGALDFGGEIDTTGLGAAPWAHGTKALTDKSGFALTTQDWTTDADLFLTAAGEDSLSVLVNKLILQLDSDSLQTLMQAVIAGAIAGDSDGTAIQRLAWLCQQEYIDSAGLVAGVWDVDSSAAFVLAGGTTATLLTRAAAGGAAASSPWTVAGVDSMIDMSLVVAKEASVTAVRDSMDEAAQVADVSALALEASITAIRDSLDECVTADVSALALEASVTAVRDSMDEAAQVATGFSTHSAADVWAVGTRTLTALDEDATTIDLNATAVGSVAGGVGSVTGSVLGNVNGSVGSVTGNVGGSVASVTGAVGSVTGNVGGNVTGSVGSVVAAVNVGSVSGSTPAADTLELRMLRKAPISGVTEGVDLKVASPGYVGVNWGDIYLPSSTVSLSNTTIKAVAELSATYHPGAIAAHVHDTLNARADVPVNATQISGSAAAADSVERQILTGRILADVKALDGDTLSLEDLKDFADDGYDPAGDTVHTDIALAGSLIISDADMGHVADSVWQKNRNDVTKNDGMYGKLLDTTTTSRATTGTSVTDADMVAIADTILNRKSYQQTDTTTVGGRIHALGDSLISQEWATAGATDVSDGDMIAIADTVLGRKAHQKTDTSTVGGIIHAIGDSLISQEWATSGASAISDADIIAIADTVLNRKSHQHDDTTTIGGKIHAMGDSLSTQLWAGSSYGSGLQVDSIFVYDSSGTDTPVPGVSVTIKNAGMTADVDYGINTNSSGYVTYNLNASTAYKGVCAAPGYTFPVSSFTTGAGATNNDTVWGYNITVSAPDDADLKRIYGWIKDLSDRALSGAIVSLSLDVPHDSIPCLTGTGVTVYRTAVLDTTDANGYWQLDIYPTDALTPAACTYQYRATYNNEYLRWHKKTFSPTGTTSQPITDY
jgi:peptidoglycan/xylan/chitin deacetylase (PgdA/CDA1 family)